MSLNLAVEAISELASLDPLIALLAGDIKCVNAMILERLASEVPVIPELAGHLIAAGGKRIRPMMTLAGARIAGGSPHAIGLATAVEFIHSATLLHDDVIDQSHLRRGRETANALWGNEASVLVGDFLFARAFELMVEAGDIDVLGQLANASARITEGEIKQMAIAGQPDTAKADYLDVITGKTAVLFAAAAAAGARLAGANSNDITVMYDYGMQLGLAFQIMDDAMDYAVSSSAMGKNAGDDFTDQKITLPVILAWQGGDANDRKFWQRTMGDGDFADGDLATAQAILTRHDALNQSITMAGDYANAAIDALTRLSSASADQAELISALAAAARFSGARQT
ncbi:MAG: polyprenyl synthetase family protein [Candidatus Puniceispirillum sp.]|nr:polyprenyl synthetase family protein [Candidatus Puniceispirillum sp.]